MGNHRPVLAAALGILLSLSGASVAFAQASEGLQIKPAIIEDKAVPGQAYYFTVTIKNISSSERTYTVTTKDISGLDDNGSPIFAPKDQETPYSLSSWIQVPQAPITLVAGESRAVPFTALVPANASPGAHFGGVFFDYQSAQTSGNGSAVSVEVGNVISLQIAGDVIEDARMREFSTNRTVYGAPVVAFATKVENMGNVLERPRGLIQITDMFGKQVATLPVNDALAPVFPGAVRTYATDWNGGGFAIGRYQAVVSLSYGSDSKRTVSSTTSFWVIPFKLVATILGVLVILIIGIYLWVRMYLRKQLRAMGVSASESATDLGYYGKKYNRMGSRLALITVIALLLCALLLVILFILFA